MVWLTMDGLRGLNEEVYHCKTVHVDRDAAGAHTETSCVLGSCRPSSSRSRLPLHRVKRECPATSSPCSTSCTERPCQLFQTHRPRWTRNCVLRRRTPPARESRRTS